MTIADKLTQIAERMPLVYEAGQKSMVDESKIIEKTVSGSVISLDDVSEIPHDVTVQLSSDTVTNFSGVAVNVLGKNLFDKNKDIILDGYFGNSIVVATGAFKTIAIPCEPNATYTVCKIAGKRFAVGTTRELPKSGVAVYGVINNYTGASITITTDANAEYLVAYVWNNSEDTSITTESMVNSVLIYEPHTVKTYTANADGTVSGVKSVSPYMTILTDTLGVDITTTHIKSWVLHVLRGDAEAEVV